MNPNDVTIAQADICADFMLDQEPEDITAPLYVLDALGDIEYVRALEADARKPAFARAIRDGEAPRPMSVYIELFRQALERWLSMDRQACVSLLGPGLGIEQ